MNSRYDVYDGDDHVTHTHNTNTAEYYSAQGHRVTAVSGDVALEVGR